MKRTRIIELLQGSLVGQQVNVKGWVRTRRGNKAISFIALNDGSTIHNIQIVVVDIQNKLLKVLEYFELDYACLDLCVDKNGEFWLLDVNPFGRYKWIELAVGLEISQAIAELLLKMRR